MSRILPALAVLPAPALAHEGLHHHPHGAEGVWLALTAALAAAALGLWLFRGRK